MNTKLFSPQARPDPSLYWFLTGFGLVCVPVFAFLGMVLSFIAGFSLASWHFPLALLAAAAAVFFAARHLLGAAYRPAFLLSTGFVLAVVLLAILVSLLFYDISVDGQLYHLDAAIHLKNGWNPFRHPLPAGLNQALWLNHYGKGAEAPEAAVYAFTNRVETTKSINFIVLAASFCLSMCFLLRLGRFSFRKNLLFAAMLAGNPVVLYFLLTTYVDGQLGSYLLCLMAVSGLLYREASRIHLLLLSMLLILVLNIKFSAVVFAAVFMAGLLLALILSKQKSALKRVFLVCLFSTALGLAGLGYFPYVINTVEYRDPFYPGLAALHAEAAKQAPEQFARMDRFSRFFISFFSHTDDLHNYRERNPRIPLKIPFSVNRTDLYNALKPYVSHMAGFGPFFSGIGILALLFFGLTVRRVPDGRRLLSVTVMLLTLTVSVFVISEAWYARYVPQLWFIPVVALIAAEYYSAGSRRLRNALYLIVLLNLSFSLAGFPYVLYQSAKIDYELAQLKASGQTIRVQFSYFVSNRVRFLEQQIPFQESVIPPGTGIYMVGSSTRYISPQPLPEPPRSWVLRTGEAIEKRLVH